MPVSTFETRLTLFSFNSAEDKKRESTNAEECTNTRDTVKGAIHMPWETSTGYVNYSSILSPPFPRAFHIFSWSSPTSHIGNYIYFTGIMRWFCGKILSVNQKMNFVANKTFIVICLKVPNHAGKHNSPMRICKIITPHITNYCLVLPSSPMYFTGRI